MSVWGPEVLIRCSNIYSTRWIKKLLMQIFPQMERFWLHGLKSKHVSPDVLPDIINLNKKHLFGKNKTKNNPTFFLEEFVFNIRVSVSTRKRTSHGSYQTPLSRLFIGLIFGDVWPLLQLLIISFLIVGINEKKSHFLCCTSKSILRMIF